MKQKTSSLKLREFLPYRLSVLSNRVSSLIATAYSERFNIRIPEWRVIAVLGEEPGLTSKEVANQTAMDKVSVSRAVQSLVGKKHVRRFASQKDGRVAHLRLSQSGVDIYQKIAPLALRYEEELAGMLSVDEMNELNRIFDKLSKKIDELEMKNGSILNSNDG